MLFILTSIIRYVCRQLDDKDVVVVREIDEHSQSRLLAYQNGMNENLTLRTGECFSLAMEGNKL